MTKAPTRPIDPIVAQLARRRRQVQVSQRVLARACGYASPSSVWYCETGRRTPNLDLLHQWVQALGGQLHIVWLDEDGTGEHDPDELPGELLTPEARRHRILADVAAGRHSPGEIATRTGVSERTVHRWKARTAARKAS